MSEDFTLTLDGGVATLALDRASDGNVLSLDGLCAMKQELAKLDADARVRVLVLRSKGEDFCLGRAPSKFAGETTDEFRIGLIDPILDVYAAMRQLDVPIIAAVQGHAAGLGCALASCCDIVIASQSARFSLPEMSKDLPPTLAVSALTGKIHPKAMASMVLALNEMDASTALSVGLVSELCRPKLLDERVETVAAQIASRDPLALAAIKRYLRACLSPDHEVRAELAGTLLAGAMSAMKARTKARS